MALRQRAALCIDRCRWPLQAVDERPHEALGDLAPVELYRRSIRKYPRKLLKHEAVAWREACDVDQAGCIRWHKRKLFVSSALAGEVVELERIGAWTGQIRFLDLLIAELDERNLDRGVRLKRRPRSAEG